MTSTVISSVLIHCSLAVVLTVEDFLSPVLSGTFSKSMRRYFLPDNPGLSNKQLVVGLSSAYCQRNPSPSYSNFCQCLQMSALTFSLLFRRRGCPSLAAMFVLRKSLLSPPPLQFLFIRTRRCFIRDNNSFYCLMFHVQNLLFDVRTEQKFGCRTHARTPVAYCVKLEVLLGHVWSLEFIYCCSS